MDKNTAETICKIYEEAVKQGRNETWYFPRYQKARNWLERYYRKNLRRVR